MTCPFFQWSQSSIRLDSNIVATRQRLYSGGPVPVGSPFAALWVLPSFLALDCVHSLFGFWNQPNNSEPLSPRFSTEISPALVTSTRILVKRLVLNKLHCSKYCFFMRILRGEQFIGNPKNTLPKRSLQPSCWSTRWRWFKKEFLKLDLSGP